MLPNLDNQNIQQLTARLAILSTKLKNTSRDDPQFAPLRAEIGVLRGRVGLVVGEIRGGLGPIGFNL